MIEIALKYQFKDGFQCKNQAFESVILASNTLTCNQYSASGNPPGEAAMSWRGGNQNHRPPANEGRQSCPKPLCSARLSTRHSTYACPPHALDRGRGYPRPAYPPAVVCLSVCVHIGFLLQVWQTLGSMPSNPRDADTLRANVSNIPVPRSLGARFVGK